MSNIARDSDIVELTDAPSFDYGDNVRANRTIRNDGTYVGKEIGEVLVKKGELGYVVSIGTFLQQFYIYGVEFLGSGNRVGMKCKELDLVSPSHEGEEPFCRERHPDDRTKIAKIPVRPTCQGGNRSAQRRFLSRRVGRRVSGQRRVYWSDRRVGRHTGANLPIYMVDFGKQLVVGCLEAEISAV